MINLRPMSMDDSDFMLSLKNYPETRRYAIATHDEIKREDHVAWLEKNLLWFQVIESQAHDRLGAIRIFGDELSIWVDRHYWGLGIATSVIRQVATEGMCARIVETNIASMRAFIKAGFLPVVRAEIGKYYIFKKDASTT